MLLPLDEKSGERCPTGHAILSRGPFNESLSAANVIHTVGPRVNSVDKISEGKLLLSRCIFNSLLIAQQEGYESIAFPAISCGSFNGIGDRWIEEAADCNVSTVLEFLKNCAEHNTQYALNLKRVVFIFHKDEKLFATWYGKLVQLVTNGGFQGTLAALRGSGAETASGGESDEGLEGTTKM